MGLKQQSTPEWIRTTDLRIRNLVNVGENLLY